MRPGRPGSANFGGWEGGWEGVWAEVGAGLPYSRVAFAATTCLSVSVLSEGQATELTYPLPVATPASASPALWASGEFRGLPGPSALTCL